VGALAINIAGETTQADLDVAVLFAINFTEHAECLFFTALTWGITAL